MIELKAAYFDGKTSAAHTVQVQVLEDALLILGEAPQKVSRENFRIMSPLRNCPLVIELKDGVRIEVDPKDYDYEQIKSLLKSKGRWLYWFENNLLSVFASLLLVVVGAVFLVQVVLPKFSEAIARKVPQTWAKSLDETIVEQLDGKFFAASELTEERQDELLKYLNQNIEGSQNILLRKLGIPNAFALAGNTMIISDELVTAMEQDEEILAVALHEDGHLKKRHVLSMLISSSALSAAAFVVLGDMVGATEWFLNFGVFLVSAKYSRGFEKEADAFAITSLKSLNLSPACFKEALLNIDKAYTSKLFKENSLFNYISSHPDIRDRVGKISDESCGQL